MTNGTTTHQGGAHGAPSSTAGTVLNLEFGQPYELALKYAGPGKEFEGRYGPRIMYTVWHAAEERRVFVDPAVARRIDDLGLRAGEPVTVLKRESRQGGKRGVEWVIERVEAQPQRVNATAAPVNTHQLTPQGATDQSQASTPLEDQLRGSLMLSALKRTIDIARAAQAYAADQGMPVQFTGEDIRALAITAFIQISRGGGTWPPR